MSATSVAATTRLVNPLPGLRPFYESEQHLFFGRESQIDTMINKLWPPGALRRARRCWPATLVRRLQVVREEAG